MSEDASDNYEGNQEENYESSGPKKNKYETAEVEFIQQEIQLVTRKIEREKIKLRIADERLEAKKKMYNQLQGKPVQKTDEEKEREHKKKLEENKAHKLEIVSKPKEVNKAEEFRLTQRRQWTKINKQESELESLTKTINETNLKIEDLKFEIDNLRKRKVAHDTQLKKLIDKNKELKTYTDELKEINEKGFQNVEEKDVKILSENKEEGIKQNREFQTERNGLEDQYHKIIEANIQRERDRIKEQAKKRQMLGIMAKQVMKQSGKNKKDADDTSIEEQIKKLRSEEICDRIPILDLIIEKWKNINKCKKSMLIKYNQNSQVLKKSFDIIMKFLGVEEYEELPIIYQKNEEQTASIQMYICELLNEKSKKEEKKNILLNQIKILDTNKKETTDNKQTFNNNKQANIERLKDQIKNIEDEIKIKRDFFCSLQPMSDKFLNRLNDTYVRDYVPNKIRLNVKYNEHNISNVFDNISNYYKLITELEQSVDSKTMDNSNKILESLGNDFNSTLDNFMHDSFLNPKIIKQEHKNAKGDYEQTIRRLAENFINLSNTSGFSGFNTTKSKMKEY